MRRLPSMASRPRSDLFAHDSADGPDPRRTVLRGELPGSGGGSDAVTISAAALIVAGAE
jgi:hypothetical protein